jgi:hypothetical protein
MGVWMHHFHCTRSFLISTQRGLGYRYLITGSYTVKICHYRPRAASTYWCCAVRSIVIVGVLNELSIETKPLAYENQTDTACSRRYSLAELASAQVKMLELMIKV